MRKTISIALIEATKRGGKTISIVLIEITRRKFEYERGRERKYQGKKSMDGWMRKQKILGIEKSIDSPYENERF